MKDSFSLSVRQLKLLVHLGQELELGNIISKLTVLEISHKVEESLFADI